MPQVTQCTAASPRLHALIGEITAAEASLQAKRKTIQVFEDMETTALTPLRLAHEAATREWSFALGSAIQKPVWREAELECLQMLFSCHALSSPEDPEIVALTATLGIDLESMRVRMMQRREKEAVRRATLVFGKHGAPVCDHDTVADVINRALSPLIAECERTSGQRFSETERVILILDLLSNFHPESEAPPEALREFVRARVAANTLRSRERRCQATRDAAARRDIASLRNEIYRRLTQALAYCDDPAPEQRVHVATLKANAKRARVEENLLDLVRLQNQAQQGGLLPGFTLTHVQEQRYCAALEPVLQTLVHESEEMDKAFFDHYGVAPSQLDATQTQFAIDRQSNLMQEAIALTLHEARHVLADTAETRRWLESGWPSKEL
jgi:hypothetical protein